MMRLLNRFWQFVRGRKVQPPVPAGQVKPEDYDRWLGI
jgi:hypothetical protein